MKYFTPVIHVESLEQTKRNVDICIKANTHGFFLISHRLNFSKFYDVILNIRNQYPDSWMGINVLDKHPQFVIGKLPPIQGYWVDNPEIEDDVASNQTNAKYIKEFLVRKQPKCLYFGSVAFKYQNQPKDLSSFTKLAKNYVDIVTTSGDKTGKSADISKIKTMYDSLDGFPLAIASGISNQNISQYINYVDWFLVSTNISIDESNLDFDLVKQMSDFIKQYERI
jgi:phosphoribosylanthranilate isomerase